MAQAAFILAALFAALFFARRKKIDPLAVAFGSSLLYFVPAFFGEARFSYGQDLGEFSQSLVPAAYATMGIVLAALVTGAAVVDRIAWQGTWIANFQSKVPSVLLAFAIIATGVSISHTGVYYLCLDKTITLEKLDPWYSYAALSAPFLIATAYVLRQRFIVLIGCVFLIADLYAGFRTVAGITLLALVMLSGARLFQGWKSGTIFVLVAALTGAALFMAKALIVPAKHATGSYCEAQLILDSNSATPTDRIKAASNPLRMTTQEYFSGTATNMTQSRFYLAVFVTQAEPFVIQATLNEVIKQNFQTGAKYLVGQILSGLPFGASLFGVDSSSVTTFSSRAQPVLFPNVSFGMANNPWAQAYAAGGLWMVAAFALGYATILGGLTLMFRKTEGALKAGVAVIAVWVGFYFHRNDLFIEIGYLKHVVYIFAIALLVAYTLQRAKLSAGPAVVQK